MTILIKNGHIITAKDDFTGDIFIDGECIAAIGRNLQVDADKIIDASDKLVFPGGVDPHVHLSLPVMGIVSSDDYSTGTRAALFGGTTTVIDFANQPHGHSLLETLETWKRRANKNAFCDYSFHITITDFNEAVQKELKDIIEKEGITSFKTFMAYKGSLMIDDRQMKKIMEAVKTHGALVTVHATNGNMIDDSIKDFKSQRELSPLYHYLSQPEITETEASGRFIHLSNETGVNGYIVHMTCEGALNKAREAREQEQHILAETCPQYLLLDATLYNKGIESAKWVMSPPLRERKDQEALWQGIRDGMIQTVGTDHCPFMWEDKLRGRDDFTKIPNGAPGIEHRMELLFSEGVKKGRISLKKFVEVTSTNAAKIFGLYPKKGCLAVRSDADIVIFDPNKKHVISAKTHHHNCDYSAYEGWEVCGKVDTVFLRGSIAMEKKCLQIEKGFGEFLKRGLPRMD